MLSNLAAFDLDEVEYNLRGSSGFTYARYADDLTFFCWWRVAERMSIGDIHIRHRRNRADDIGFS